MDRHRGIDLAEIQECFPSPPTTERLIDLAYILFLALNQPRGFIYSSERSELAGAIRIILAVAPELIRNAECEVDAAKADGRTTDMDHFAWRVSALLDAAKPLSPMTRQRNVRGCWHGYARMLMWEVLHHFHQQNQKASFSKETGRGTKVVCKLLKLAGFADVSPSGVVAALRSPRDEGG